MKNITMTCPSCHTPDKAVGDPTETRDGYTGRWYCFQCHASGSYTIDFTVLRGAAKAADE